MLARRGPSLVDAGRDGHDDARPTLPPTSSFIQHNYGVFTSIDPFNNAQGQGATLARTPTAGKAFNTDVELLFIAIFWLGRLCAVVRLLRRGLLMRALPFVVLAVSPFFVLFGQNYGGEASLRIILFSSPWCAALISWALGELWSRAPEMGANDVRRGNFHCPIRSFLPWPGRAQHNFAGRSSAQANGSITMRGPDPFWCLRLPAFHTGMVAPILNFDGPEGDANPNLLTEAALQGRPLGAAEVPRVAARIKEYSQHGYIVFDKDETAYAEVFRITPPGATRTSGGGRSTIAGFPALVSQSADVRIYELTEPPRATLVGPTKRLSLQASGQTNCRT